MRLGLMAACIALATSAGAEPITLSGTIGGKAVFLDLSHNGDTLSGWYFYLKTGKQIRLDGKLNRHGFFDIDEHTASTNTRTGSFSGRIKDGRWSGTWKNAGGTSPHPFAFVPVGALKNGDGRYHCTAKRKDESFGYSLTHSIDLALTKGKVKSLSLIRRSKADGEEPQSCTLSLRDMKQVADKTGITLRAKADPGKCSLRITPAGDYLIIRPGQASQAGDDCRTTGHKAICSPNAFWSDLVLNRRTQSCKSVE